MSPRILRFCCLFLAAAGTVLCLAERAPSQAPAASSHTGDTEELELALGLMQRGLHDDAKKYLQGFLKRQPHHRRAAEAHYRLGTCCLELGEDRQAIRAFDAALEQARDFSLRAECRYRLGHALKKEGRNRNLERAARQFQRLVAEEGNDHYLAAASCYAEGECLRDLGQDAEALARFRKAASLDQRAPKGGRFGLPALYQAGFLLLKGGRHKEASASFLLAAKRYPKHQAHGECLYLAGEAALRAGEIRTAEDAYRQSVAAGGEHAPKAMLGLARCAVESGDREQAIARFREVGKRFRNHPSGRQAKVEAGRLLFQAKRHGEAVKELTPVVEVAELPPDLRRSALEVFGLAQLQLGKAELAISYLEKALALTPNGDRSERGRIAYHLGEAHGDKQDWDAAADHYGRSVADLNSSDGNCGSSNHGDNEQSLLGDALYGQCLALHRLGRFRESNRAAAKLLECCPRHRLAMTARFAQGENHFASKNYEAARKVYVAIPEDHELGRKSRFKAAWCSYLLEDYKAAGKQFQSLAAADRQEPLGEEALSMAALALFQGGDFDAALATADRYRARHPRGKHLARSERVAARVLRGKGNLEAAAERLAAAAAAERSGPRAGQDLLEYADLLYQRGDYEGAGNAYRKLVDRKDAAGARAHEGLAWCAFELGEDAACGEWIDRGLEHPKAKASRANLLELQCTLYHRQQDWAAAEKAAARFLGEFPDHARRLHLVYALALAQTRQAKLKTARQSLKELTGQPGFDRFDRRDRVWYELAWVHRKLGDEKRALESFREVAQTSRDKDLRGEANLHLGEALLEKEADEALAHLAKVEGRYRGRARYRIGSHWFGKKQFHKALPAFDGILQLGPEASLYLDALFLAGECHYRLREFEKAAKRLDLFLKKAPDHQRAQLARLHLGVSQVHERHAQSAAAVLQEYLRRAGEAKEDDRTQRARGNLWLGKARQQAQKWAAAEAAYLQTTRLTDTELAAEAQYRIGECRRSHGDLDGAADAFVKLSILYGHDTWVQQGLLAAGDCYLRLEQPQKAKRFYQELLDRFPKAELAKDARVKLEDIKRRL